MRLKNAFLIMISLLFYAYGESVYVCLMVACAYLNYIMARLFAHFRRKWIRRTLLVLTVVINLGILGFFKYAGMAVGTINRAAGLSLTVPQIRLPIGISFFTFQALSYTVDVYRGKVPVEKSFSRVLLYISFFPQLIAGPIIQYSDVSGQLKERNMTAKDTGEGLRRFIFGLSKKVLLSNTMGSAADYVFSLGADELGAAIAWTGAVAYMLQIYFDFSGYSDMAIGLGRMFGFRFMENFRYPYVAASIQDFWRRWHISLTSWFREYVYIPLGGNRKGKTRTWLNRLLVFFCTGLWHGANWTFVLWGLFHGFFFMLETIFPNMTKRLGFLRHLYVLLVVCTGFVLFRSDTIGQAALMLKAMFTGFEWNIGIAAATARVFDRLFLAILPVCVIGALPVKEWICERSVSVGDETQVRSRGAVVLSGMSYMVSLALLTLCMMSLAGGTYNPFIYFRF